MKTKNTVWIVVGTRPNFIKITQFRKAATQFQGIDIKIVHTGQHFDEDMANIFFKQFDLAPDVFLEISPGHPGVQIAKTIEALSLLFLREKPDMVMVVGDVNSTLAGAIAANKCNIPTAHLESGLRSFDLEMPEEHNRRVADLLSNLHFVTEDAGLSNLKNEGISQSGVVFVGNTMIDTLVAFEKEISEYKVLKENNLQANSYCLLTMHRPSNVDHRTGLSQLLNLCTEIAKTDTIIYPVHPRTRQMMEKFGIWEKFQSISGLIISAPQSYFGFQKLVANAKYVLTDSGGIQEETTYLQKPCITLRPNTERPCTVEMGSNTLLPFDIPAILQTVKSISNNTYKQGQIPLLWDGKATMRVLQRIEAFFETGI